MSTSKSALRIPRKQVDILPKNNEVTSKKKKASSTKRKLTAVEATLLDFQKKNYDINKMIESGYEVTSIPRHMIQDRIPNGNYTAGVVDTSQPVALSESTVNMASSNFDSRTLYRLTLISEAIDNPFTELSLGNLLENYRFASSVVGFNITNYGHRFEVSLSNFTVYGELIMHGLPDVRHDKIIKFHPLQSLFDIRLSNVPIGATAEMIKQLLKNEGCSLVNDYTIRNEAHVTLSRKSFKTGRWRVLCYPSEGLHLPADNDHCTFFPDRVVVISCSKRPPASFPLPRQQPFTLPSTTIKMAMVTNKTTSVTNKTTIVTNKTPYVTNKAPPVASKAPPVSNKPLPGTAMPPLSIHLPAARTLVATITPCTSLVASLCAVPSNSKQHSFVHDRQVSTRSQSDLSAARLVASLSVMSDRYSSGSGLVPRASTGSGLVSRAKISPSSPMSSLPAKTSALSTISSVSASTNVSSLLEPPSRKKVKLNNTVNLPTTRSIQAKGDDPLEVIHFTVAPQNYSTSTSKASEVKESYPSNDLLLLSDCILMKEKYMSDKSSDSLKTRDVKDITADETPSIPDVNGMEVFSSADTPLVSAISQVSTAVSLSSDKKIVQTLANATSDCSLSNKSSDSLKTRDGNDVTADQTSSSIRDGDGMDISSSTDTPLVSTISDESTAVSLSSDTKVVQTMTSPTSDGSLSDKSSDSLKTRDGNDVTSDQSPSSIPGGNGMKISSSADTPLVSTISHVSTAVSLSSDTKVIQTLANPTSDCSLSSKSPIIKQMDISFSDDAMVSSTCNSAESTTKENTGADSKNIMKFTTSNFRPVALTTKENEKAPNNSKLPGTPNET